MNGWEMFLGDIKTAFLNSDPTELEREIYGDPPSDVKEELGMNPKDVFRIRKAVYGLLNAPRKWLEKLARELKGLGWKQSSLDNCVWRLFENNRLVGILGVHVDDVVCGGHGKLFDEVIQRLKSVFPFGSWKSAMKEKVTFCGCELHQEPSKEIILSQERFALGLNEINLTQERKQQPDEETTPAEKKAMRGLLGGLAWRATQTAPWLIISLYFHFAGYANDGTGSRFVSCE